MKVRDAYANIIIDIIRESTKNPGASGGVKGMIGDGVRVVGDIRVLTCTIRWGGLGGDTGGGEIAAALNSRARA